MEIVKENEPQKYRAVLARQYFRELYLQTQQINVTNRTQQRWMAKADQELFDLADIEIDALGSVKANAVEIPDEQIEREFSKDAMLGIRLALVLGLKGYANGQSQMPPANALRRKYLLTIAECFGRRFRQIVETDGKLPESDEDEKAELDLSEKVAR